MIANQLVSTGRVSHAMIGVGLDVVRSADGSSRAAGARVAQIRSGGPADRAGLRPGDVIVAVAGQPVQGPLQVVAAVDRSGVGRPLQLKVIRSGTTVVLVVVPTELNQQPPR
jgi:S1-C subfamily serine protease